MRKLFFACAVAILVSLPLGMAYGQDMNPNQRTFFTFSQAVELPGGTSLPAGKYLFRIVDSPSNRHTIQVLSEDEKTVFATLLAIPANRNEPSDEPEVRFMEVAANMPPAIRTWWYPGRTIGHEFIYPKDHARRLAAAQTDAILTAQGATIDEMRTAELSRISASGQETAVATTQTAQTTVQPPVETPAPVPAPPVAEPTVTERTQPSTTIDNPDVARARVALPTTATVMPLVALLGFGSFVSAAALRLRRRK
jgi:hypothetical protein